MNHGCIGSVSARNGPCISENPRPLPILQYSASFCSRPRHRLVLDGNPVSCRVFGQVSLIMSNLFASAGGSAPHPDPSTRNTCQEGILAPSGSVDRLQASGAYHSQMQAPKPTRLARTRKRPASSEGGRKSNPSTTPSLPPAPTSPPPPLPGTILPESNAPVYVSLSFDCLANGWCTGMQIEIK